MTADGIEPFERIASNSRALVSLRLEAAIRRAHIRDHRLSGVRSRHGCSELVPAFTRPSDARGPPHQCLLVGAVSVRLDRRVRRLRSKVVVNRELAALRRGYELGRTSRSPAGLAPAAFGAESHSVGGGAYPGGFVDRNVSRETSRWSSSRIMTIGGQGPTRVGTTPELSGARPRDAWCGNGAPLADLGHGRAVIGVRFVVRKPVVRKLCSMWRGSQVHGDPRGLRTSRLTRCAIRAARSRGPSSFMMVVLGVARRVEQAWLGRCFT